MDTTTSQPGLFGPLAEAIASNPDAAELVVLESWRVRDVFRDVQAARKDAPPFVFWEGPPTANGRPGIHHVLARTIKDTVCRFQTMLGKRVDRKAGWDTHGLPVELEVEKALGISGKPQIEEYGVAEFNANCRESVWKYREEWERLSERIGFWLDYDDPYVTYDERYVESVWNILARFHHAGLVYRGKRVVPYCGRCGTGLSSHEIGQPGVYRDILDPSVTVRFRLARDEGAEPASLLAWTTTPWTLPSNVALAVHPRVDYVLARVAKPVPKGTEKGSAGFERVWLAEARAAAVLGEFEVLERSKGADLVGIAYEPLFAHEVTDVEPGAWEPDPAMRFKVVSADYVTTEDGTGIVHQAPSYGADDWTTAQVYALPVAQAVGAEGRFLTDFGPVSAGTFFKEADAALMEDLKQRGLMFKKARENHSYPHCWRCDTPLFYYATPAWYIRTTSYKDRMIEYNSRCNWVPPEVGEKRFSDWLENNIDWNISRERYWGTPLPFWVCDRDDTHHRALGSVAEIREAAGGLPEGFDNHKPSIDEVSFACTECDGRMVRTKSVVDCWFDSGSMPYAQHHWPFEGSAAKLANQFPADFIAEGLDQTRGWFYSLLAVGAFLAEDADELPSGTVYKNCVVNGLVLDKDGVKMSKRLGNIVDPWEAVKSHGIDAVRWYMLSSGAPWLPKRFDMEGVLEVRRRFLGTLINSYRFLADYARIDGFDPSDPAIPALAQRPEIDRWLSSRSESLVGEVRRRMSEYDLAGACRSVEGFVVNELSNWYIRRNRRRFWKGGSGPDKLSAYASLHGALRSVALLIAPAAPFLAEMLWERLQPGGGSVHAQLLPVADDSVRDERLEAGMRVVERVVEMGRALRERNNLRVRQPLRALHLRASDPDTLELLRSGFAAELVLDELNIKTWGSLAADDGQLCTLKAKANFKTLGKRLGKRMKPAAAAIGALAPEQIAALRGGDALSLELDGEEVELTAADVEISVESQADFDVEADGRMIVFLDTELDDELLREGLAREAVNRLNSLRKQAGLAIDDRIRLHLDASGTRLGQALQEHGDFIAGETLAESWKLSTDALPGTEWSECELGEGELLRVSLARA